MLGIRMGLAVATKPVQKLSMHKVCPDCGAHNDLGTMYDTGALSNVIIPQCGSCGSFLWKRLANWKKWVGKRGDLLDDPTRRPVLRINGNRRNE